jgi:hypothetical protein
MTRSARRWVVWVSSILFAGAPIVVSLIAALGRRHDLRWLWMALASLLGAIAARALAKPRREPGAVIAVSALAFVVGAIAAALVARLLGARAVFGIWAVATVLSFCWAASFALATFSRSRVP